MKKVFALLLALLMVLPLAACGAKTEPAGIPSGASGEADKGQSGTSEGQSDEPAGNTVETYTVSYYNAGMSNQTVEEGTVLQQPTDPTKANHIFGGWYVDEAFTTPATFPITVNGNTSLYARFYDYQTAFQNAREKTIGAAVPGYEYDYTTTVTATYSALSALPLSGNTAGNAKYSSTGNVSFYDAHTNSGVLFYDGSKYQIRRGNQLQKISLDENDRLIGYEVEEVGSEYRFDSSSFAKALFDYDASQLKSIEKTSKANEYKLKTSFNASAGVAMASKLLNSAVVKKAVEAIPENQVTTGMYVTFANGAVSSYRYEMQISAASVEFTLVYSLTFKNVGTAKTISPRTFANLALSPEQISQTKSEVDGYLSAFEAQTASGYDFTVKTGVDFPSTSEINSTFKGSAQRKTIDGVIYFHNDIEIDSDYKNEDLYKTAGIADVHIKRTRLTNGDVYNIEKKLLSMFDSTDKDELCAEPRTDFYYLFDLLGQIENYTFAQKVVKDDTVTYSIGIAKADVAKLLAYLNTQLNLDPLGKTEINPLVFGDFAAASVVPDEISITVVVKSGALSSITLKSDGEFSTSFAESRDFTAVQTAEYNFTYTLTVNASGSSFTPYETVSKAK